MWLNDTVLALSPTAIVSVLLQTTRMEVNLAVVAKVLSQLVDKSK
jgi:hypothetical protein